MSISCGHCKSYHPSTAQVRVCSTVPRTTQASAPVAVASAYYATTVSGQVAAALVKTGVNPGSLASVAQLGFIRSLVTEREVPATGGPFGRGRELATGEQPLLGTTASAIINWLKQQPFDLSANVPTVSTRPETTPVRAAYATVGEGYFAVASLTGNNDFDFFRIDRPTEGRWAGYTFVKRVIGGNADAPVRGLTARRAVDAILAAGERESARLYGQEIGRCGMCNRHLTDETSRAYGLGPDCRKK